MNCISSKIDRLSFTFLSMIKASYLAIRVSEQPVSNFRHGRMRKVAIRKQFRMRIDGKWELFHNGNRMPTSHIVLNYYWKPPILRMKKKTAWCLFKISNDGTFSDNGQYLKYWHRVIGRMRVYLFNWNHIRRVTDFRIIIFLLVLANYFWLEQHVKKIIPLMRLKYIYILEIAYEL